MAGIQIVRARRSQLKARIALMGVSGSGKTMSALRIMRGMIGPAGRMLVGDSEHASASMYAGDGEREFEFDVVRMEDTSPETYLAVIQAANEGGYNGLILDSLTHVWKGAEGFLAMKDAIDKRNKGSNSYTNWREVDKQYGRFLDAMLSCWCDLIVTLRTKQAHAVTQKDGKNSVEKLGMEAEFRDGIEYEFQMAGDIDLGHNWVVSKSRLPWLDGKVINLPDEKLGEQIAAYLNSGEPLVDAPAGPALSSPPAAPSPSPTPAPIPAPPPGPKLPWQVVRDEMHEAEGMLGLSRDAMAPEVSAYVKREFEQGIKSIGPEEAEVTIAWIRAEAQVRLETLAAPDDVDPAPGPGSGQEPDPFGDAPTADGSAATAADVATQLAV